MRLTTSVLTLTAGAALFGAPAIAQIPAAPRELGMGGAYMGVARGHESVFLSPGNIALPGAPRWSFAFPQVALAGALYGPAVTDLKDLFQFDEVSQSRQDELLALIPNDGTRGELSLRSPLAAFTNGGFGLGVAFVATGGHTLSRDVSELFLEGFQEGRRDYDVSNTFGSRASYWDFAASYGRNFAGLSVGVTGHYIRGGTIARTQLFPPRFNAAATTVEADYVGVLAHGGSGYAADVGAALNPVPGVTLSGAVSNVFSSMDWSEDQVVRFLLLDRELIDNARPRDLLNRYEASEVDRGAAPTSLSSSITTVAGKVYDDAVFPSVARIGVAWNPLTNTHIAADFHKKLTDGRLGDVWDQRMSIGIQQQLPIIAVRAGYSAGSDGGNLLGGGISLGPLDVSVGRWQQSDIGGNLTRGYIGMFGLGVDQPF